MQAHILSLHAPRTTGKLRILFKFESFKRSLRGSKLIFEPTQEILVLMALSSNQGSGKLVQIHRLTRALLLTCTKYGCR